jgi:hypothetical protein
MRPFGASACDIGKVERGIFFPAGRMRQPVFSRKLPSSARPTVWIRALCEYTAAATRTAAATNGIVRRIKSTLLNTASSQVIFLVLQSAIMIAPENYREITEFV